MKHAEPGNTDVRAQVIERLMLTGEPAFTFCSPRHSKKYPLPLEKNKKMDAERYFPTY